MVDGQLLQADDIVIATGSYPSMPQIPGIELAMHSDHFFDLDHCPKSVAMLGSGYIAVELAGLFMAFGCETNLVIRRDRVLTNFDAETGTKLTEAMEKNGMKIHKNSGFKKIELVPETGFKRVSIL